MPRRASFFLLLIGLFLGGLAWAQSCVNHIAVDGDWLEGPGFAGQAACYFLDYGNHNDAFTPARLLADAMGLELATEPGGGALVFSQAATRARLRATGDIAAGLEKRSDVFTVDGAPFSRAIPSAIVVDGSSWVPVGSLADAFGATATWDAGSKVIFIETAAYRASIEAARAAAQAQAAASAAQSALAGAPVLGAPESGYHGDFTRVALDIPAGADYQVRVDRDRLVLGFPGLQARNFTFQANGYPHVANMRYGLLEGVVALEVETKYALGSQGQGYKVVRLPSWGDGGSDRLYVDLGPDVAGEPAAALTGTLRALPPQPALAGTPQVRQIDLQPTVVLDPGHGGHWAGARHGGIREEILVLEVAAKVKALLEAHGINVVMTRTSNVHLSEDYDRDLVTRADFATAERNLFVSIHANAAADPRAEGIETFIFGQPLNNATLLAAIRENGGDATGRAVTDRALVYAGSIHGDLLAQQVLNYSQMLAESVQSHMIAETGASNRGVRQAPFRVLTQSSIPAILVELGFVTNPTEGPRLAQDAYQAKLAEGIASGILAFFESNGSVATR